MLSSFLGLFSFLHHQIIQPSKNLRVNLDNLEFTDLPKVCEILHPAFRLESLLA